MMLIGFRHRTYNDWNIFIEAQRAVENGCYKLWTNKVIDISVWTLKSPWGEKNYFHRELSIACSLILKRIDQFFPFSPCPLAKRPQKKTNPSLNFQKKIILLLVKFLFHLKDRAPNYHVKVHFLWISEIFTLNFIKSTFYFMIWNEIFWYWWFSQ